MEQIDAVEHQVGVRFDDRVVKYDFGELDEVSLAYAITIHKSQGSEFSAVVIPLAIQHYMLLQRNLIYMGIAPGKRLLVLIGTEEGARHCSAQRPPTEVVFGTPVQPERRWAARAPQARAHSAKALSPSDLRGRYRRA